MMYSARRRFLARSPWIFKGAIVLLVTGFIGGSLTAMPPVTQPQDIDATLRSTRRLIQERLDAGEIGTALSVVQDALKQHPGHAGLQREFIDLHISVARQMFAEEKYGVTESAVRSVLSISPQNTDALKIQRMLEDARAAVPRRVEQAKRWLKVEWFEPAFNGLRQAAALIPKDRPILRPYLQTAAVGAADDHYFCKNFRQAFYYYDAAIKLIEETGDDPPTNLIRCWFQSMVFAVEDDSTRTVFPATYWQLLLQRAEKYSPQIEGGKTMRAMLRGLSLENMGAIEVAASEYALVSGRDNIGWDRHSIGNIRQDALRRLRGEYNVYLSSRRQGTWRQYTAGDWQILKGQYCDIYHRNEQVSALVETAINFQFERIARRLGTTAEKIPWRARCSIYVHATEDEFRRATKQPNAVGAISTVRRRGAEILEQRIDAYQTDPLLLSATLTHELVHLIVSTMTEYRDMKPAISEGIALSLEPICRRAQFSRLFGRMDNPPALAELLRVRDLHPNASDFYTAALRLVEITSKQSSMERLLNTAGKEFTPSGLAKRCRFKDLEELNSAYLGGPTTTVQRNP